MVLHNQGNPQQNATELSLSAASPLGQNKEAESMLSFNLLSLLASDNVLIASYFQHGRY